MRKESVYETVFNSVSHGIGLLMSVFALSFLLMHAEGANQVFGILVFGISLIFLYLSSTLYHAFPQKMTKVRSLFRRFDHSGIYLLIAGTYVPFVWILVPTAQGYILMGALIGSAIFGIVLKVVLFHRFKAYHYVMYLVMGWSVVTIWSEVYAVIPTDALYFLVIGGLAYTIGLVFYAMKNVPFMHLVWHFFVLAGSMMHFFSIYNII